MIDQRSEAAPPKTVLRDGSDVVILLKMIYRARRLSPGW
jgi:hypothetical protein